MLKFLLKISKTDKYARGRSDYYSFITRIPSQLAEVQRLLRSTDKNTFQSRIFIQPLGCLMGSSIKEVIKTCGKPHYTRRSQATKVTTLVYKQPQGKSRALIQLHFLNRILTFAKTEFTSSSSTDLKELHEQVFKAVTKKYLTKDFVEQSPFFEIRDKRDNILLYTRAGFFPCIYYLSDAVEMLTLLKEHSPKPTRVVINPNIRKLSELV